MAAIAATHTRKLIGRQDVTFFEQRQRSWWIGKPWRRLELNVFGEGEYREWEVTWTIAAAGWHLHGSLARSFNDYSEEPNQ